MTLGVARTGPLIGHRDYVGFGRYSTTDNQAELLPRLRAERARRALYAGCDRAPLGWERTPIEAMGK